jgi:hypothetical protein
MAQIVWQAAEDVLGSVLEPMAKSLSIGLVLCAVLAKPPMSWSWPWTSHADASW